MTGAFRLVSRSEDATRRLGRLLGGALQPSLTVLLSGDLGAGKTAKSAESAKSEERA